MAKKHYNEFLKTRFHDSGRIAGTGIDEEDYSEESFPDKYRDKKSRIIGGPLYPQSTFSQALDAFIEGGGKVIEEEIEEKIKEKNND